MHVVLLCKEKYLPVLLISLTYCQQMEEAMLTQSTEIARTEEKPMVLEWLSWGHSIQAWNYKSDVFRTAACACNFFFFLATVLKY